MGAPALPRHAFPTPPAPVTAEQLLEMDDDGLRRELVRGEVREEPLADFEHGRVAVRVGARISEHVEAIAAGVVVAAGTGFRTSRDPDTVRAPDAAFVSTAQLPPEDERHGFPDLAPDLVVEVVSPSDRAGDVLGKAMAWVEAGVRLVWVVYPDQHLVVVHGSDGSVEQVRAGGTLDGADVLPGLRIAVDDLFT